MDEREIVTTLSLKFRGPFREIFSDDGRQFRGRPAILAHISIAS